MPQPRNHRGQFIQKAIAETVASVGAAKAAGSTSLVGRGASAMTLSPRQAYELDVHVRKAVGAIARNVSKATVRLFDRQEREITAGRLADWVRQQLHEPFLAQLVSWYQLEGEMAVYAPAPDRLIVLDPGQLMPVPFHAATLDQVTDWRCLEPGLLGEAVQLDLPSEQVVFLANWNPHSRVRGLSPVVSGAQQISQNYFQARFNSAAFQNGGHRDLVFRFPKGTARADATAQVKAWEERHSIFAGQAFRISAVIGDEMQVEEPGQSNRDGQYLELRRDNAADIMALFGVPAIEAGLYDRTRFDTAQVEREMFYESTLLPQLTVLNHFIQGLAEHCWTNSVVQDATTREVKVGRVTSKQLTVQRAHRPTTSAPQLGGIVLLCDPDTLPIASAVNARRLEAADKYRRQMGVGFAAAAEWAGLDRPSNQVDDAIYIDSTLQHVGGGELSRDALARVNELERQLAEAKAALPVEPSGAERLARQALKAFYKALRPTLLASLAKGEGVAKSLIEQAAASHLPGVPAVGHFVADLHLDLVREIQRQPDDQVAAARKVFQDCGRSARLAEDAKTLS